MRFHLEKMGGESTPKGCNREELMYYLDELAEIKVKMVESLRECINLVQNSN